MTSKLGSVGRFDSEAARSMLSFNIIKQLFTTHIKTQPKETQPLETYIECWVLMELLTSLKLPK